MKKERKSRSHRLIRVIAISIISLALLCLVLVVIAAIANQNLPTQSGIADRLSEIEKARLAEAFHLRQELGGEVWEGWGIADIPIIVYNESYAFLVGYPDPPPGWIRIPKEVKLGGSWELAPGDSFQGQAYYRQALPDPEKTPENFTVLVGDQWVATLQTKEYAEIAFINGFGEELPPPIRPIFPYRLAWNFLGGDSEVYIGGLAHESFHAYQGQKAKARLYQAEEVNRLQSQYPWADTSFEAAWKDELTALYDATQAENESAVAEIAQRFLHLRTQRRQDANLSADLIDYERQREWLEGLAKYTELELLKKAAETQDYVPVLADDPQFEDYESSPRYWSQQLVEVKRSSGREGDIRFYYSGRTIAVLLDRLMPGWKDQVWQEGVWLEDLLLEAVK